MDFHHLRYEMNVKIQSIVLVLTRTKLRQQFCHCARSISRRVRSRTWTAIRSLSYSTLSLGITRFWNFSNPLSGCKVTKFDPPFAPRRGARGVKKIWGCQILAPKGPIFAIKHFWNFCNSSIHSIVTKFDPPLPPFGGQGGRKNFGGRKNLGGQILGTH